MNVLLLLLLSCCQKVKGLRHHCYRPSHILLPLSWNYFVVVVVDDHVAVVIVVGFVVDLMMVCRFELD